MCREDKLSGQTQVRDIKPFRKFSYSDGLHSIFRSNPVPRKKRDILLFSWHALFFAKRSTLFIFYCSTVHFRRITSIYQAMNERIISHKTL